MSFENYSFKAGGTIYPMRFVKLSTTENELLQCGANEQIWGVSQEGAKLPLHNEEFAAGQYSYLTETRSDAPAVNTIGDICDVIAGGSFNCGDRLKSDADGKAVAAATTGTTVQFISGRALEAGVTGQPSKILVESYPYRPAIA